MLTLKMIGIMSALPQETDSILSAITEEKIVSVGKKDFVLGNFERNSVVFSLSGIGKVSAAITESFLIEKFKVSEIIFTGVAGGGARTNIGESYLEHDLDLRPIFSQFYIYNLKKQILYADPDRVFKTTNAAKQFLKKGVQFPELGILTPKVLTGLIVSGDQFIGTKKHHQKISDETKTVSFKGFDALEMEGASVAHTCQELQVPFIVLRAISDKADQEAHIHFSVFMDQVASHYSLGILREYFQTIN